MRRFVPNEVSFEASSVVDPVGKVFHHDHRVFRAITEGHADAVRRTVELAHRRCWFDHGLVETSLSQMTLQGYALVLEHRRIPFVTLRGEWSAEGLRSAALCLLDVAGTLLRSGYCLKDAHPWNVLFEATTPVFIDWGSICLAADVDWKFWYAQFRQYVLAPLYAFSLGHSKIARAMLREHYYGVGNELVAMPPFRDLPEAPQIISDGASVPTPGNFEALGEYVHTLVFPRTGGEWLDYEQPDFSRRSEVDSLREKDRIVRRLLADDPGRTLIDIGTNRGLHAGIAAALGKRVLAGDIEEACLNQLFLDAKQAATDLMPIYLDFLWPIGTSGILNSIPAAEQRLACDTALAMALVHHLAFKQYVSFEAIAKGIRSFGSRRAIVEFIPANDVHVALWTPERLPWYTLDNFLAAMRRHYEQCTIVPSDPYPRAMLIFEHPRT